MPLAFTILLGGLGARAEEYLAPILEGEGYRVRLSTGFQPLLDTLNRSLDLVIVDLPSAAELAQLVMVRAACSCSLVVMGPAHDHKLLVETLDLGADDYVQRPFRTDELLARIRAQLRRHERSHGLVLSFGPLTIDPQGRQATCDGMPLAISSEEFAILATLAARPGYACSATLLLEQVWGHGHRDDLPPLIQAVAHLRAIIEPNPLAPTILGGSLTQGFWLGGIAQERELNGT
jgi:DNA-binding response OmpR family regulator